MSSPTPHTALIVGATGIAGQALSRLLVDAGWEVLGLSRRGASDVEGVVPVQADLTDAAGLRDALAGHRPTHVFVTAWARQETEAENIRVNGGMVGDVLEAVRPAGSVRHVALLTGLKHYLGPFEAYGEGDVPDTPFHEDEDRLPYPNFYYAQEDELFAAAERDGFTWSVHRAHTIIGVAGSVSAPLDSPLDAVVIGAGQAGLSTSYHLARLGLDHVVLDAEAAPGGAWRHRWDSLTMDDVHGVADLPDGPAPGRGGERANVVIPRWFADYERRHALPVVRPVRVSAVEDEGALLVVRAGERSWTTRTVVNATGTWSRPFVPHYPGQGTFLGEQLHTVDYPGAEHFRGKRVLVVGGGASAVQLLGEIAPVTDTVWVTRSEPVWRDLAGEFDGRAAIGLVADRVRRGLPPRSVVSVTGIALRAQEEEAAKRGAYQRRSMFARIEPDGVRWGDGTFEAVDVILWATGFRPAVGHLAPLGLRTRHGGIRLLTSSRDVQSATTAADDPRVQLVGYGPSASTIGGNRAGRAAALAVQRLLRGDARVA